MSPMKNCAQDSQKLSNLQDGYTMLLCSHPLRNKAAKFHANFYPKWEAPYTIVEWHGKTLWLEDIWENIRKYTPPEYTQDTPASQPVEQLTALMQSNGDIDPVSSSAAASRTHQQHERQEASPSAELPPLQAEREHQEAPPTPDLPPLQAERCAVALLRTRPTAELAECITPTLGPAHSSLPPAATEQAPGQWRTRRPPATEQYYIFAGSDPAPA
ncbi:hypothetical protein PR048_014773 [Dryococelus australis]|uniref:Uncharacterized protein n=1 Tax=Dryococelus australis TaxID=614101 RepID=A0ABQ9HF97_9NEOP|nr:hypothetical protein PR048_014773 [Dryococelus australis]